MSVRKQSGVQGNNPSQMRLGKVLQHSMSHCEWRREQQLFDKRQSNFPWLFNLHLLTVPAESLAQGSPGDVLIQPLPWLPTKALCPSRALGSGAHRLLRVWGRGRRRPAGQAQLRPALEPPEGPGPSAGRTHLILMA